ncbi:unnamed protein product [Calypogeia fissa]
MSSSGASSSQSPSVSTSSEKITQVNESLYELYKPPGTPRLQILFFHGLQLGDYSNAHVSTWQSADGSCIWPQTWLVDEFPDAHVLTVSYSGAMSTRSHDNIDMRIITENLLSDLMQSNIGQTPHCPVILVGHSIGGVVIKALCCEANEMLCRSEGSKRSKLEKFLGNLRGVFFYATPNQGSEHATKLANNMNSTLLTFFETLSKHTARLNQEFNDTCKMHDKWRLSGLGEALPTRLPTMMGLSKPVMIVPDGSSRVHNFNVMEESDHLSISKPRGKESRNFYKLQIFVKEIDDDMKKEAQHPQNYQDLPKSIGGINGQLLEITEKVAKFRTLGLFGMGGLGKTTLAMATFNTLAPQFEYTCFVANVKKFQGDVNTLKTQAWEQMHRCGEKVTEKCKWYTLRGKKLLLALDDITDDFSSTHGISILLNLFRATSSESRVIVTSREGELEKRFDGIHRVKQLTKPAAREVFRNHAFPEKAQVPQVLEKLVNGIVSKCGGLPLALGVLGSYLYTVEDQEEWQRTHDALQNGEAWSVIEKNLWAVLRISYNGLNEKEQQIFLDATTFFSNTNWTLGQAKAAWRVTCNLKYVERQWQTLVKLSLVHNVKDHEHILVHEQLQSLGRVIASDSSNNGKRRVWDGNEGIEVLSNANSVDEQGIRALHLGSWDNPGRDIHIPRLALPRLESLQYLEVRGRVVIDEACQGESFPTKLVLLRCSASRFGRSLCQGNLRDHLVVLKIEGPCESSTLPDCLADDPPSTISKIGSVLDPELDEVPDTELYASDLQSIMGTIGDFSKLAYLDLHGCGCVRSLPETFGQLSNLKHLKISAFRHLYTLPESFGQLSSLTHLGFYACSLKALPESFGQLKVLRDLEFYCCDELQNLPESFGRLAALTDLKFLRCLKLSTLSESFGQLKALKHLEFEYCRGLNALPESFGSLEALSYLKFEGCSELDTLPESFGQLPALQHLEFHKCEELVTVPESFKRLEASSDLVILGSSRFTTVRSTLTSSKPVFRGLRRWPLLSVEDLRMVSQLEFESCRFQSLPESIGQLEGLTHLKFRICEELETLPESFGRLKMLRHLEFEGCTRLNALPESFGSLGALSYLKFEGCSELDTLPESFGQLPALRHLEFVKCQKLLLVPESFKLLEASNDLVIFGSFRFTTVRSTLTSSKSVFCGLRSWALSSVEDLRMVRQLEFESCSFRYLPESIGQLEGLTHLKFRMCRELETLPESFGRLKMLRHLEFEDCTRLNALPESFGSLVALSSLKFKGCSELDTLPESFGQLPALRHLEFHDCRQLVTVPESFKRLEASSDFVILGSSRFTTVCSTLTSSKRVFCGLQRWPLSSVEDLRMVRQLEFESCSFRSLPESIGQLEGLTHLKFRMCGIVTLPESFGRLKMLKHLEFEYCWRLNALPESFGSLGALSYLKFEGCSELDTLQESFGRLKMLRHLEIKYCWRLNALPESFGSLEALSYLKFKGCSELDTLQESFGRLKMLRHLEFKDCRRLNALPESFGSLDALSYLKFKACSELDTLPESFGQLPALQHLEFDDCQKLLLVPESFKQLEASSDLVIFGYSRFTTVRSTLTSSTSVFGGVRSWPLSSVEDLRMVRQLEFESCSFRSLPESIGQLEGLTHLKFRMCGELETLPESFGRLKMLSHLEFEYCGRLNALPESFGSLEALSSLKLDGCSELDTLPESFGRLKMLSHLKFEDCTRLNALPESFGSLDALSYLKFKACSELDTLQESFGRLKMLRHLEIKYCWRLNALPESFGSLEALSYLKFKGCSELDTLPESFGRLKMLSHLEFEDCSRLNALPESFGSLEALSYLKFKWCSKLDTLPESFGQLRALRHLEFDYCQKLLLVPESFKRLEASSDLGILGSSRFMTVR